jgi:hypothetical protein
MMERSLVNFTTAVLRLGSAFGKATPDNLVAEYYRVFGGMSDEDFTALVDWAIRSLDTPFPSIARLRRQALEQGWLKENAAVSFPNRERKHEEMIEVICPLCDGSFVIKRSDLLAAASEGKIFQCVNAEHWGCRMTFSASEIAARSGRIGPECSKQTFTRGEPVSEE